MKDFFYQTRQTALRSIIKSTTNNNKNLRTMFEICEEQQNSRKRGQNESKAKI